MSYKSRSTGSAGSKSAKSGVARSAKSGVARSAKSTAWMAQSKCNGLSHFYFAPHSERPEARVRREAKAMEICETCDVIVECRNYARANRELGFWGGENEADRADAGFRSSNPIVGSKSSGSRNRGRQA